MDKLLAHGLSRDLKAKAFIARLRGKIWHNLKIKITKLKFNIKL